MHALACVQFHHHHLQLLIARAHLGPVDAASALYLGCTVPRRGARSRARGGPPPLTEFTSFIFF